MLKRCSKCKNEKDISEFNKSKKYKDNLRCWCKTCENKDHKKWRIHNGIRYKYNEIYKLKKYNLTLEEYKQMVKQQNNKCLICGKPEISKHNGKVRDLAIDHDHKTNKTRGLLCTRCNTSLGFVYEDKMILMKLINYIDIYK